MSARLVNSFVPDIQRDPEGVKRLQRELERNAARMAAAGMEPATRHDLNPTPLTREQMEAFKW